MPILHVAILALIQGATEFLPISSSGHLVLVPALAGWPDQGLIIDVAVHVGTLGAVMAYFWRDMAVMGRGLWGLAKGKGADRGVRLFLLLVLATVPVVVAGFWVNSQWPNGLRSLTVIGWATLGFGVLLWLTDRFGMTMRRMDHLGWGDALVIGLAQVLALIPGASRSGVTMSAARMLGMERPDAARFSMLLSIPTIVGAGALKGFDLYQAHDATLSADAFIAAGMALVSALVAIAVMMAWLKRATFAPFVVYRIVLGGVLLSLSYGWFV